MLPIHDPHDPKINLKLPDDQRKVGPIYQLAREEERLLPEYIEKMIQEGKIQLSNRQAGSPSLVVPKPNRRGLRQWVDYRQLNNFIAYSGLRRIRRCLEQPEAKMSCTVGEGDVVYRR
jgi:hypothetical protein